jgi:hypothetical protein
LLDESFGKIVGKVFTESELFGFGEGVDGS